MKPVALHVPLSNRDACLRCAESSSYRFMVDDAFLCPECCAVVDPGRFMRAGDDQDRTELEHAQSRAHYFDHEWAAMGWKPPATVTHL